MTDVIEGSPGFRDSISAISTAASAAETDGSLGQQRTSVSLRGILVTIDFGTIGLSWLAILESGINRQTIDYSDALEIASATAVVACCIAWTQRLYQARACAVRANEFTRVVRVAIASGLAAFAVGHLYGGKVNPMTAEVGAAALTVILVSVRTIFSGWLRVARSQGNFTRPVCVLGSDDEAEDLVYLLRDHPELGYRLTAVVGDPLEWRRRVPDVPFIGVQGDPVAAITASGAGGVLVATSALVAAGRDRLIARLIRQGMHVQISSGLSRVGHQRLRVVPLAHQLAFYVDPPQLSRCQALIKRALDLAVASVLLLVTAPLIAVVAIVIKIDDRGPIVYRQVRIGRDGRPFDLLKLRTMVPDATDRLCELIDLNEREGPLFKVTDDPRVTRVGRFLRTSSIDELPQLLNVIRGEMSLVGPRPALPSEALQFDADLLERTQVPPGISGLWQVEARDSPSFRTYRRLDLFYVDNWSVGLDLCIMGATARRVVVRLATALVDSVRSTGHKLQGR